jgi:hypothetical protein
MKTFNEWATIRMTFQEAGPAWGGQVNDRSLEGFRHLLDQLKLQTKSVMDPQIKQQIYQLLNPFYTEMWQLLTKYKAAGKGYSSRYQYQAPPGISGQVSNDF